ncbi:MAG: seryl-tRNA synthetase, partial [Enterovirga sp.]|nr:seryl-tRNA synthetase [Enterovirga sp.]
MPPGLTAMHDIRLIRDDPAAFDAGLESRGLAPLSAELLALDDRRRAAVAAAQAAQERRNALSKEVGAAKKAKDEARAAALMAEVAALKEHAPALEAEEKAAEAALRARLAEIPNLPAADVPIGADEHDNVQREDHRFEGDRQLGSGRQHFELGESWTVGGRPLMDFEAAAKLSGSRFVVLRGQLARLERALGQFMLDLHTSEHGYTEVSPPLMVRDDAMFGTAQLPKFAEDQFYALSSLDPKNLREDVEQLLTMAAAGVERENQFGDADREMAKHVVAALRTSGINSADREILSGYVIKAVDGLIVARRELQSDRLTTARY